MEERTTMEAQKGCIMINSAMREVEADMQKVLAQLAEMSSRPPPVLAEPEAHVLADRALAGFVDGEAMAGGGSFADQKVMLAILHRKSRRRFLTRVLEYHNHYYY